MFKDTGYNIVCCRKHELLNVTTMRKFYDFWEKEEAKNEDGKELFSPKEIHPVFHDLGLFMYLDDEQNLADSLRLTYNGWYFATHGKQLQFLRHKMRVPAKFSFPLPRNYKRLQTVHCQTKALLRGYQKVSRRADKGTRTENP